MYIFNVTRLHRDGSLDNTIVWHELTHGLSSRLTGGPENANCLINDQAAAMGEGWSDAVALMMQMTNKTTRNTPLAIGSYVMNNTRGIRKAPYSCDMNVNPHTYHTLTDPKFKKVHGRGEIVS
jgi:extracellular elastinolytic metalloproteinase